MRRGLFLMCALLTAPGAPAAEKIKPLPAEFLEYLSDLEGEEEDWTFFADEKAAAKKPAPAPAKTVEAKQPSQEAVRRSTDKP